MSCEKTMHEPARARRLAHEEAFAKHPKSAPLGILRAEIIAGERALAPPPPFGRDALRPLEGGDLMQDAAPAKPQRRAIRHAGDGLDRLRPRQQPDRAGGKVGKVRFIVEGFGTSRKRGLLYMIDIMNTLILAGVLSRRRRRDGEFWRVDGVEGEPRHAPDAEPRAEPVDEIGEIRRREAGLDALAFCDVEAIGLLFVPALDFEGGEADDVEAIAGVEGLAVIGVACGLEAFAETALR